MVVCTVRSFSDSASSGTRATLPRRYAVAERGRCPGGRRDDEPRRDRGGEDSQERWDPSHAASICPYRRLETQGELRVLGHHLRGPGWVEDHLRVDLLDPVEVAHELAHLLGDLGTDRTGGRREAEGDEHLVVLDLDVVDEAEGYEVEPQLGVD